MTMEDQVMSGNEIFKKMQNQLLQGQFWTFDAFRRYNVVLFDLYGGNKGKAKPVPKKDELDSEYAARVSDWETAMLKKLDPSVRALRQKIKVLDCLNPIELASNHKSVFSRHARKLIANKAKVPLKEVDSIILEHDGLRADRKWYQTRMAFKLPLPSTMEEREKWSSLDRPFSRSEMELGKKHQERTRMSAQRSQLSPKRITSYVFRTPSKGISRWS